MDLEKSVLLCLSRTKKASLYIGRIAWRSGSTSRAIRPTLKSMAARGLLRELEDDDEYALTPAGRVAIGREKRVTPRGVLKDESRMSQAVARYLSRRWGCKKINNEVTIAGVRFDVVGYNEKRNVVVIAECKRGSGARAIGNCFGQLLAYRGLIFDQGEAILDALSKEIEARGAIRMAIDRKVKLEFFVALGEPAFERSLPVLRYLKKAAPEVGLIRVKATGECRMRHVGGKLEPKFFRPVTVEVPLRVLD